MGVANAVTIICFCILILIVYAQDALHVFPTGNVGIGVEDATEQLEIGGNVKAHGRYIDKTGVVMPLGTILPFAGPADKVPEGWIICDGRAINRTTYVDLFEIIGTAWGTGDGSNTFNIPDLRGMFLRGVDSPGPDKDGIDNGPGGNDPDTEKRGESAPGSNKGNLVGSRQEDEFKSHNHRYRDQYKYNSHAFDGADRYGGSYSYTENAGGNETRPKNAYVNYIIKF
ncbi:MAG: tail fiber protein [Spirochaetales bacterium]|nr:tail fiber protein [Spirochaetales bacterium]